MNVFSGRNEAREKIGLFDENIELSFLGSGYPMYFDFVKGCLLVLFMILISSGAFNLLTNFQLGKDCQKEEGQQSYSNFFLKKEQLKPKIDCYDTWTTKLSYVNKIHNERLIYLQDIMNLITVCTIIFILQYLRTTQRNLNERCDELCISASDYTIWISQIPQYGDDVDDMETQLRNDIIQSLQNVFKQQYEEALNKQNFMKIANLTLSYKLDDINNVYKEKQKITEQFQNVYQLQNLNQEEKNQQLQELKAKAKEINQQITELKRQYYDGLNGKQNNQIFTGHAFVSFENENDKNLILDAYQAENKLFFGSKNLILINGQKVKVQQAPECTDVNWEFLQYSTFNQLKSNIISTLVTILLLVICGLIIFALMYIQDQINKNNEKDKLEDKQSKIFAILISAVIPALNYGLQIFLTQLSIFEKHYTRTEELSSLSIKLTISQFLNTAIMTFLIKVGFFYFNGQREQAAENIYSKTGLVFNQQYVFITSGLIAVVSLIVDPSRIVKIIMRYTNKKKIQTYFTQRQINALYEDVPSNLAQDYAALMKNMFVCIFYSPLIPLGIVIQFVSIGLLYFIQKVIYLIYLILFLQKWKLLNHRCVKYQVSHIVSQQMIEIMEFLLPLYTVFNLFKYIFLYNQRFLLLVLNLFFCILNKFKLVLFLTLLYFQDFSIYQYLRIKLTKNYFMQKKLTLLQQVIAIIQLNFNMQNINLFFIYFMKFKKQDYDRANPATDEIGKEALINKQKEIIIQYKNKNH
ncbi:hypothetical protein IMG5_145910 [Ichthyophthirius multifiliis]|uniref:CSC1/OSCA1-like cytosolic domain-containing protein n=1 Tax=Ichthyophthirius multifiliis TaxID=5932 RepID=G0QXY4_ICHMU|nr:hypothetical protein IMG5_145910 [Ichthyophthirius multifiliis]EGR29936.1 hypothetical protein IMG5_145910 [Ichthyophthirius multifiliis]|eukprot:XP_004031172.1 hypothetical protein IMG5_145910 [Ichthyophthirius multifiliis]